MSLVLGDSAVEHLAAVGFDPVFGARPVKRALQRELQTLLAKVGATPSNSITITITAPADLTPHDPPPLLLALCVALCMTLCLTPLADPDAGPLLCPPVHQALLRGEFEEDDTIIVDAAAAVGAEGAARWAGAHLHCVHPAYLGLCLSWVWVYVSRVCLCTCACECVHV